MSPRRRTDEGPRVVVLLGEEEFLADQELRRRLDGLLPPEERAMNLDALDGETASAEEIIRMAETLPFFGSRRVVVLRRAEKLKAADQEALAEYLNARQPLNTLLVLAEDLDKRRRFFLALRKAGEVLEFNRVRDDAAVEHATAFARRLGTQMTREVARELVTLAGTGLRALHTEVAKLAAAVGDRPAITIDDVRALTPNVAEVEIWALVDAVGQRRPDDALGALHRLLRAEERPIGLVGLLGDHFRTLMRVQALTKERAGRERVAEVLGRRAWKYAEFQAQVAQFAPGDLPRLHRLLLDADRALKSSRQAPTLVMETLVLALCGATGAPAG